VRLGPPGIDPAYFLGSSLSTPTRRALEHDLLREFHDRLASPATTSTLACAATAKGAVCGLPLLRLSVQVASSERVDR